MTPPTISIPEWAWHADRPMPSIMRARAEHAFVARSYPEFIVLTPSQFNDLRRWIATERATYMLSQPGSNRTSVAGMTILVPDHYPSISRSPRLDDDGRAPELRSAVPPPPAAAPPITSHSSWGGA